MQESSPERRARLVIADDHEATRVLLHTLVSLHPEIEVVGEADNGEEAARLAVSGEADIALLDIEMPRMDELNVVIAKANSFGYVDLKVKRAPCGGYQAYVAGFSDKAQSFEFAQTARERSGLPVTIIKA